MAKTRVHQLAKELGIDSKLIMEEAERHGIQIKNHMSSLSDSDEMMLRAYLEKPRAAPVATFAATAEVESKGAGPPVIMDAWVSPDADDEDDRANDDSARPEFVQGSPHRSDDGRAVAPPRTGGSTVERTVTPPPSQRNELPAGVVARGRHLESNRPPTPPPVGPTSSPPTNPPAHTRRPTEPAASPPPPREIRAVRPGAQPGPVREGPPTQHPPHGVRSHPGDAAAAAASSREAGDLGGPHAHSSPSGDGPGRGVDAGAPPPPRVVRAVPTTTAVPPRAADAVRPIREPAVPRRQAEIVGRRELPIQQRPMRPGQNDPAARGNFPQRGGPGGPNNPGSGLIATRSEGGKRTFVVTGRGRPGPGGRPGGPLQGPPGQGGFPPRGRPLVGGVGGAPGMRDRGERSLQKPRGSQQHIQVPESLTIQMPTTVKGLSEAMGVKANVLIQRLFVNHKKIVKINDPLDKDTVELLGIEFDCDIKCVEKQDVETMVFDQLEKQWEGTDSGTLVNRAPIVTFLGHVDHGKTSLLDAIRSTNVAAREHGGITQHIGATRVVLPDGRAVVFLDTPGHRAFTEMRARGAQVTDVVVLVVAADDGVMPQTKEAIAHARAAECPIVVALNKIDKPEANPLRVRQELANEGLMDEKWGGKTMIVETAATSKRGITELIEALCLEAEVLELRANPNRPAVATVIEAEQSRGEGNVARLIITDGTLRRGALFVCGTAYGRVRAIKTTTGETCAEAGPAMPVEIAGLNELPRAGDKFYVLDDLEQAKEIAGKRQHLIREKEIAKASHVSLENLFEKLKGATLKIILKVDVTGSLEVLQREIMTLAHPEVRPDIIHAAVGGITETDVTLADASDAVILGFHVSADMGARRLAEQLGVEIRIYQVIYKLIEELTLALEGHLKPEEREVITGEAEIRKLWKVSRIGTIAGCYVQSGAFRRNSKVRVSRGGIVIHDNGSLESLKRLKDDVREVKEGLECGMVVQNFENIEVGDTITSYEVETIKRTFGS